MRCKFCFATFQDVKNSILPAGHLTKEEAIQVVQQLADFGFKKITFAGGEPTLCKWLPELIATAKKAGMITMIVTNGSRLTDEFLKANRRNLDWIAISVDSLEPATNLLTGRAISGKRPLQLDYYKSLVDRVKQFGYGLKINTVVNRSNYLENMSEFIRYAKPKRWKIFQVLPIDGQNDQKIDDFRISEAEFLTFIENHRELSDITNIVPETNTQIKGSYAMVDPAGRFFDNSTGKHNYSQPILQVGCQLAIKQVDYSFSKFVSRGGLYNWNKPTLASLNITLSGEVASGKSTIGKLLADKLNFRFVSIGNRTRDCAKSLGIDIVTFQKQCLSNPEIDKSIDKQFSAECNSSGNLVIDYRLGFKFIRNSFNIFLKVSEESAIERLKAANRANETHQTLRLRNQSFKNQFQNSYGIDYTVESHYDLVINVADYQSPDEIVQFIINSLPKLE